MDDLNKHGNMGTRSIPILVDNSLNRAVAVKYAMISLFGLVSGLSRIVAGRTK